MAKLISFRNLSLSIREGVSEVKDRVQETSKGVTEMQRSQKGKQSAISFHDFHTYLTVEYN